MRRKNHTDDTPAGHCHGRFDGMKSGQSGTYNAAIPASANQGNPASNEGIVSKIDMDALLYPGTSTLFIAHIQPWFMTCHGDFATYPPMRPPPNESEYDKCSSGHIQVGYNSNEEKTVAAQLKDMKSRGFDAVAVDWYGEESPVHNGTTLKIANYLDTNMCSDFQNCDLMLAIVEDHGAFKSDCAPSASEDRQDCITAQINKDLDYMKLNYFGKQSYLRVNPTTKKPAQASDGGKPVVLFFVSQMVHWSGTNWFDVWNRVRSHTSTWGTNNPLFIFRDAIGFTNTDETDNPTSYPQTNGAYAWHQHAPESCGSFPTPHASPDPLGLCHLHNFYKTSVNFPSRLPWGAAWKGNDSSAADWASGDDSAQRCGQTWLKTLKEANHNEPGGAAFYSSSRQLPFMQIGTWNDYEEGTAIEVGIENCHKVDASVDQPNRKLNWTLSLDPQADEPGASGFRTIDTISEFVIYDSSDGQNLTVAARRPNNATSLNLRDEDVQLGPGQRTLYVKAVGVSSVRNKLSNPVGYDNGGGGPTGSVTMNSPTDGATALNPISVVASATGSNPITVMQIYVDGSKVGSDIPGNQVNTTLTLTAGMRRLTVQAKDNQGNAFKTTRYITVCGLDNTLPSVTICTPRENAGVFSPVRVLAGAQSNSPITLNQIYVDGVEQHTENDNLIDHNQGMSTGLRRLTVQAKDSTGAIFKDTHFITVCSKNTADPSVTICSPSDGSLHISPVHVTAAVTSTQPVQYMQIYVDGVKTYERVNAFQIDTNLELSPGNHQFTVQSNNGATFNQTIHFDVCALNATGPSVTICTPQDEASVGTTVRILAAPTSSTPVRLMQIFVDGVKTYEIDSNRLDTKHTLAVGRRRVTVQAIDTAGGQIDKTIFLNVQ